MATVMTWASLAATVLGLVVAILKLWNEQKTKEAIKTEQERNALARQVAEQDKAREIEDEARAADLAALRERMLQYQRPDT